MSRKASLSLVDPLYQSVIPVTLHMNLFRLFIHTSMQIRCPNGFYACNINYIILLRTTLLQVYWATVRYTAISGGFIALQCMKPKLPSPIFRGDNNQTTAAIETIEHYGTYLFFLMKYEYKAVKYNSDIITVQPFHRCLHQYRRGGQPQRMKRREDIECGHAVHPHLHYSFARWMGAGLGKLAAVEVLQSLKALLSPESVRPCPIFWPHLIIAWISSLRTRLNWFTISFSTSIGSQGGSFTW